MKIHAKSQQIIDETFELYKDSGEKVPAMLKGSTIIHMYPKGDTMKSNGDLDGYYQNRFFKMIVFNETSPKNREMYTPTREYDAIFTHGCKIVSLSVFKDGAFCIRIDGDVQFLDGQACTFHPLD